MDYEAGNVIEKALLTLYLISREPVLNSFRIKSEAHSSQQKEGSLERKKK